MTDARFSATTEASGTLPITRRSALLMIDDRRVLAFASEVTNWKNCRGSAMR